MKLFSKKLLLSIGTIGVLTTPIVSVISCTGGDKTPSKPDTSKEDNAAINAVTDSDLNLPKPSDKVFANNYSNQPSNGTTSNGVSYTYTRWEVNNDAGTIKWTVELTKGMGTKKTLSGELSGFLKPTDPGAGDIANQDIANVTASDLNLPVASKNKLPSLESEPSSGTTTSGVYYEYKRWVPNNDNGSIEWEVLLSKKPGNDRSLSGTLTGYKTTSEQHLDDVTTNSINALITTNKDTLPSNVSRPLDGNVGNNNVSYTFKTFSGNNTTGIISWSVTLSKDTYTKDLSGSISGFLKQSVLTKAINDAIASLRAKPPKDDLLYDPTLYDAINTTRSSLETKINSATTIREVNTFSTTGSTEYDAYISAIDAYLNSTAPGPSENVLTTFTITDDGTYKIYDNTFVKFHLAKEAITQRFWGKEDVAQKYIEELALLMDYDSSLLFFDNKVYIEYKTSYSWDSLLIQYGSNNEFNKFRLEGVSHFTKVNENDFNTFTDVQKAAILRAAAAQTLIYIKATQINMNLLLFKTQNLREMFENEYKNIITNSNIPQNIQDLIFESSKTDPRYLVLRTAFFLTLLNGASKDATSLPYQNQYAFISNVADAWLWGGAGVDWANIISSIESLPDNDYNNFYTYVYERLMGKGASFANSAFNTTALAMGSYGHLVLINKTTPIRVFEVAIPNYSGQRLSLGGKHTLTKKYAYYPIADNRSTSDTKFQTYSYFSNLWPTVQKYGSNNGYVASNYYTWFFEDGNGNNVNAIQEGMFYNASFKGVSTTIPNGKIELNKYNYVVSKGDGMYHKEENGFLMVQNVNLN